MFKVQRFLWRFALSLELVPCLTCLEADPVDPKVVSTTQDCFDGHLVTPRLRNRSISKQDACKLQTVLVGKTILVACNTAWLLTPSCSHASKHLTYLTFLQNLALHATTTNELLSIEHLKNNFATVCDLKQVCVWEALNLNFI